MALQPQENLSDEFGKNDWTPEQEHTWEMWRNTDIFVALIAKSIQLIVSTALLIYLAYVTLKDRNLRVQPIILAILSLTSGIFGLLRIYALFPLSGNA